MAERKPRRLSTQIRLGARTVILEPEQPFLEEVAPIEIENATFVDIGERERVCAVQSGSLDFSGRTALRGGIDTIQRARDFRPDHFDPLPALIEQPKARAAIRTLAILLISVDDALHSANEEIEASIAVDVDRIEDILTVGHDRAAVDVADRVAKRDELR